MPRKGQLTIGTPYAFEVTANTGPTAVTYMVIRRDRIAEVDAVTIALNETKRRDDTLQTGAARLLAIISLPDGTASARVKVTQAGAPVFPEETITADTVYALDAV